MTNRIQLPADHVIGQAYEHGLDVNMGTREVPDWQSVRRISGFAPTFPRIDSDVATNDDEGDPNVDISGRGFSASFNVQGNRSTATGLYLRELELLLAAAIEKGDGAVVEIRWYHKPAVGKANPTRAGRVLCTVDATLGNTGVTGAETHAITLTGKGGQERIANPYVAPAVGTSKPSLRSASPTAQTAGKQVTVVGSALSGATAVKFGAVAAPAGTFTVVNDATLIVTVPAGSAGSAPIVVTNANGDSEALPYTRGA